MAVLHRKPYYKQVLEFYFAPLLRSFFTVLYLLFFLYFVVFYVDHIVLAIKFLIYTLRTSTVELSLSYVFWGSLFIISLIVPFSVSLYAIVIPFEIRKQAWEKMRKLLVILLVVVATLDVVVFMDFAIRFLEQQPPIQSFMSRQGLQMRR